MKEENEEIDIQHRLLIEEDGIDERKLPKEIRDAIKRFDEKLLKYEETENAELYYELQQDDIAIADDIQTFIEDYESEDDDEDDSYVNEEETKSQAQPQAQAQPQVQQPQVQDLETQVREAAQNGLIRVEDLEKILKREPDYPNEQIGKTRLRKVYLKPYYEII